MINNFGVNLKSLRRKKDLTQDEFAQILNVSTQTISRWETNMGYPDIELLPAIANFYNVTVDSLLGLDIDRKKEKISQIIKTILSLRTKGEMKTSIEMCRNALKEYPYDFSLMIQLASCLFNHGETDDEKKENNHKVMGICEKILKECTDNSTRNSAIQLLCFTYPLFDKRDKALEIANSMPNYFITANELLTNIIDDSDKKQHLQANLYLLIQLIYRNIENLFALNQNNINILKSLINVFEAFFDNEDYYFFHYNLNHIYRYLAAIYANNKNEDETINYLQKATFHAIAFDARPNEHTYTSSIFLGYQDIITNSIRNSTKNESWVLLNKLQDKRYDFIRNNPVFIKTISKLSRTAHE